LKIVDAGSHDAVVAAVYNGDVDAGACYVDARTRIEKDKPDVMEKVVVLQVSAPIPNDGVQFSPTVPKDMRAKIVAAILDLVKSEEGKKAINVAYQWTDLVEKDDTFYDPFRQVLQAAGVKAADLLKK
jgi:phosphonate transport system substrate-binding protein